MLSNGGFSNGAKDSLACVFSLEGTELTDREAALFREANPFGFILFKRNIENPEQLKSLVASLKDIVKRDCPILIDQEGGRVQRLRPPHWREYKPMKHFGDLYAQNPDEALEELRFEILRMSDELIELGINVNCAPMLDIYFAGAHDIVGDRAFSDDPAIVSRLGLSVCRHFLKAGITPIIKHIPGHGRANSDSHMELPFVDAGLEDLKELDFAPFKDIASSDVGEAVWAMSAHITYKSLDADNPATISPIVIAGTIRGEIGFDGVLIGDDLDMKALDSYGGAVQKAKASLDAGCDLALYCAGEFDVMEELAGGLPKISSPTIERLKRASAKLSEAA